MSPGRVLVFLDRSDKGYFYPVYRRAGIFPVSQNQVNWPDGNEWSDLKPRLLSEVFTDIKETESKIKLAAGQKVF